MRIEEQNRTRNTFTLGPFEVTEYPYHIADMYSLYEMSYNGVVVQRQMSHPSEEDGFYGLSHTLTKSEEELPPEDRKRISNLIRNQSSQRRK